ncbi:MAG TPA: ABC transporter permease [Spirochaetota bacterium]|nr:ABC transporter permease [Spirochaetota bacterium]HNT11636.1 ABC transporter permease [Spirochaetota bacterium]
MINENAFTLVIEAGKTERRYWTDLWRFRELFLFLSWKDILVRYKQTVFGVAWSVIRPLLTMIVFTIVFGRIANLPSDGVPYPILVYTAMLPWNYFSNAFSEASNSLISNSNLISKIYFPRLIIPASSVIVSLIDFLISFAILVILMIWYGFTPSVYIVTLPLFLLLATITALGSGFLIAALNVKYRDFRYIVPFIVQFGLYISPVGFSSAVVPEKWRLLYSLNPMVGVIDGFRWAITGTGGSLRLEGFIISILLSSILLFVGIYYFRKFERTFADII